MPTPSKSAGEAGLAEPPPRFASLRLPTRKSALIITLAYALVGAVWILVSGWLLHMLVRDPEAEARIEVYKGWFYVGATALLLGTALDRYFRALRASAEQLQAGEARYRAFFEQAADGIMLMALDGSRLQVNSAFARMHGYAHPQAMAALRLPELLTPEAAAQAPERMRRAAAGEPLNFEFESRRQDGSTFIMSVAVTRVDLGGEPHLLSFHRDITESRQAQAALREGATRRRILIDGSRDGIVVLDESGAVVEANPSFGRMLGYAPEELARLHVWDWEFQYSRTEVEGMLCKVDADGDHFETQYRRKDGSVFPVEIVTNASPLGSRKLIFCVCRDITERRQAELAARQSQERLNFALEASQTGAWTLNPKDRTATRTLIHAQIFGYPTAAGEWSMEEFLSHVLPEDREQVQQHLQAGLVDRSGWKFECRIRRADGEVRWVLIAGGFLEHATGPQVAGIVQDITERKQAEAALRESEARYRTLVDHLPLGMFLADTSGNILMANPAARQLCRLPAGDEVVGRHIFDFQVLEDRDRAHEQFQAAMRAGGMSRFDGTVLCADGTRVSAELSAAVVTNADGQPVAFMAMAQDITVRKQAEAALRESEERLREAHRLASLGHWEWDLATDQHVWSEEIYRIYGRDPALPPAVYPEVQHYFTAESWASLAARVEHSRATGTPYECDAEVVRDDGTRRWITARGEVARDESGTVTAMHGTVQDITARKRAEAALQRTETQLRTLVNTLPDLVWLKDTQGVYLACNARFECFFGAKEAEIVGQTDYAFMPPEQAAAFRAHDAAAIAAQSARRNEEEVTFACDGHRELLETIKTPMYDAQGALLGVLGIGRDITERKQAETALRESEARRSLALAAAQAGNWEWELATNRNLWSDELWALYGLAPHASPPSYELWRQTVHPDDRAAAERTLQATVEQAGELRLEWRVADTTRGERWLLSQGRPLRDAEGRVTHYLGVVMDITSRKRAEAALQTYTEELAGVLEAQREIASADVYQPGVLPLILERVARLCAADGASLEIAEGSELVYEAATGLAAPFAGLRLAIAGSLSGLSLTSHEVLRAEDTENDARVDRAACRRIGLRSMCVLPLRYNEESLGVLKVMSGRVAAFSAGSERMLRLMGEFLGATIGRMRAAVALRDREQQFRTLVECSPVAMVHVGQDERITFLNRRFTELYGYTAADLPTLADWWLQAYPDPAARREAATGWHAAVADLTRAGGASKPRERKITAKDGRVRTVEITSIVLPDGVLATLVDLTAREQAETALRESETKHRTLFEGSRDAIMTVDPATNRFLTCNPAAVTMFGGASEAELLTFGPAHLSPEFQPNGRRSRELAAEIDAAVMAQGSLFFEWLHRRDDGREFYADVLLSRIAWGDRPIIMATVRDVTERRRLEDELRHSEAQLQAAQAVARMGSWHLDLLQNRLSWSPETCRIFARPAAPTSYEEFLSVIHPDDRLKLDQAWQATLAGAPYDLEHRILAAGEVRWVRELAALEWDAQRRPVACLGTVTDITERKAAEQALRDSEALYQSLVEHLGQALFRLDPEGRITFANTRYCELAGRPREELLGRTDFDLFPAPLARKYWADSQRVMTTGEPFEALEQHPDPDGRDRFVRVAKAPLRDAEGAIVGLQCLFWDVTTQQETERALRESEQQFEVAFQHSPAPSLIVAAGGRQIQDVNQAFCRFIGYPVEALLGQSSGELGLWVDPGAREAMYRRFAADGHVADLEVALRTRTGQVRTLLMSLEPLHRGGELSLIAAGVDITERKQLEDDLRRLNAELEQRVAQRTAALSAEITLRRERESQLQKLWRAVEHSPTSVVITDHTGAIEYANPRFEQQTGYRTAQVMGQNPRFLKSGTHSAEFYREMWATLTSGQTWRGELHNRRQDGTLFWELAAIAPICDEHGRITHFVGIKEDITERRRVAEELRRAKEAADAANRAKGVFLANMSHELRTPMNAVLGFTEILLRDTKANPTHRQHLGTIQRSGEHLLNLINEILELARIESERTTLNLAPFDLGGLLQDLETMFSLRAQAKGVHLVVEAPADDVPTLLGDHTKLRQVLINLLGNAFKFTPAGGQITLRVQSAPEPDGTVWLSAQVQDTGPGLKPEEASQVFEPFFQTAAGQAAGGTGLGLAISRSVARQMEGDLTVSAPVEGGACFALQARLRTASGLAGPAPAARVLGLAPESAGYRVLVVDDEPTNCELLVVLLEPLGFRVRAVSNGLDALALCQTWTPGLVLLDLRMPDMDGCEVATRLRAEHGPALKILMLSATVGAEARDQSLAAGADEFRNKPYREAELLECLRVLTGVAFLYPDADPVPTSATPGADAPAVLTEDDLRRLPPTLREALRKALLAGDRERLAELCAQAVAADEPLGQRLKGWVERYDYAALQPLLQPAEEPEHRPPG